MPPTGTSLISSSITLSTLNIGGYTFPITVDGGSSGSITIVTLGSDLTFSTINSYFIIGSDYVTIDGNNKVITIDGVTGGYPGLVRNGVGLDGAVTSGVFNNITVTKIGIKATNSSVLTLFPAQLNSGGWVCHSYFGKGGTNISVTDCYSTGDITGAAGGILGQCSSAQATRCYSKGAIGDTAGGIFGGNCVGLATDCYSTGSIGYTSGGIFGQQCSGSYAFNCYSTGTIGVWAGGIIGYQSSSVTISNCYSLGTIADGGGGITGASCDGSFTHCYTIGTLGTGSGGILGLAASGTTTNSVSTNNNTWSNSSANTALTGTPSYSTTIYTNGSTWSNVTPASNFPYKLASFLTSPYASSALTINVGNSGNKTTSIAGTYSIVAVKTTTTSPDYSTTYSDISINSSTGELTFGTSLAGDTYTILVYKYNGDGGYTISDFVLTVSVPCFLEGTLILCKINGEEVYAPIQDIAIGTEIKAYANGFKKLCNKTKILFSNNPDNRQKALYKSKTNSLYITGNHCLLVNKPTPKMLDDMGLQKVWKSKSFEIVKDKKIYVLYHLVLESDDDLQSYGIWASGQNTIINGGVLCESMSKYAYNLYFNKSFNNIAV